MGLSPRKYSQLWPKLVEKHEWRNGEERSLVTMKNGEMFLLKGKKTGKEETCNGTAVN